MQWSSGWRAWRAMQRRISPLGVLLAAVGALTLAACNPEDGSIAATGQPRGASVAFESIDGPPPGQFRQLVQNLNNEAQTHRLAVMSRESPSAYRVRGYLAAKVAKRETTISWVWDVFDSDDQRALRIAGEEIAKGARRDAWSVADDAMMDRIARSSMDQLAAFLTSPQVAPGTPDAEPQQMAYGTQNSSPEAAGIYRIYQPNADPEVVGAAEPGVTNAGPIPLPRRRPPLATAISARETLTLAASSH
jgi:hypothetical protein